MPGQFVNLQKRVRSGDSGVFNISKEAQEGNPEAFKLDPRDKMDREKEEPTESVVLDEENPDRVVKIGARLAKQVKTDISNLLREYKGIFV